MCYHLALEFYFGLVQAVIIMKHDKWNIHESSFKRRHELGMSEQGCFMIILDKIVREHVQRGPRAVLGGLQRQELGTFRSGATKCITC